MARRGAGYAGQVPADIAGFSLLSQLRVVDHAELVVVRVRMTMKSAVRVWPLVHAHRSELDQPFHVTCLLAGVQVQVHPDLFPQKGVGQLEGDRESAAGRGRPAS